MVPSTPGVKTLVPTHRRLSLDKADQSLSDSFESGLVSPTLTGASPVPAWKRPSGWLIRHSSRLCLILAAIVILQLLTIVVLVG